MLQKPAIALIVALSLAGCATGTRSIVTLVDLDNYSLDCNHKQDQILFLRDQLQAVEADRGANVAMIGSFPGIARPMGDGSYEDRYKRYIGYHRVVARQKIAYLETYCQ